MTARPRSRAAAGHARRTKPVRRASARLSPVRAGAGLAMLVAAGAIYGVTSSPVFEATELELNGLHYTQEADVRTRLLLPEGTNVFALSTEPLEARLLELATVAGASVQVRLPDTLAVAIVEREPILVWQAAGRRLLVDRDGSLFAELAAPQTDEEVALPVVDDQRAASSSLAVGSHLDPIDLDAATRLASLRPADIGSGSAALSVELTDANGFVVRASSSGWTAVFGFYTPTLRTPEIIPGQVRTLRSLLLEQGERNVARIILATANQGTFTTPAPSAAP